MDPVEVAFESRTDLWTAELPSPTGFTKFESKDLDDVLAWRLRTQSEIRLGIWADAEVATLTLGDYIEEWRKSKVNIVGKTWAGYNSCLRKHISRISHKNLVIYPRFSGQFPCRYREDI